MSAAAKAMLDNPQFTPEFEKRVYSRVTWRLIPFLFVCYMFAYVDRVNVGFAQLQMQQDLHISDAVYGVAAGIFFIGYFFFEVPCNIALQKVGAKYWLGPIMIVWGAVSACTMFVTTPNQFYAIRFLLGVVESGFFPGVILYLTFWFPGKYRSKMINTFMAAIPLSGIIGGPVSGWIMSKATTMGGLRGWQWLFLLEAAPSLLAGVVTMVFLQDNPQRAKWLTEDEKNLLVTRLEAEDQGKSGHHSMRDAFRSTKTWLLCAVYFGLVMGNYGLNFFMPQILKERLTADPLKIGMLIALPWIAAAIAMIVVGHHSDKTGERTWHIAGTAIIGALAFATSAIPGISGPVEFLALIVATAATACAYSTFWALPTSILAGTAASAGIAWINSVGNLAGFVSPSLVGEIRQTTHSTTPALLMIAGSVLASAFLTLIFFKDKPRESKIVP